MKNTIIISDESFVTPASVQGSIRNHFSFSKANEVNVKFDSQEKTYDVYQNDKYVCSFDESGNEV